MLNPGCTETRRTEGLMNVVRFPEFSKVLKQSKDVRRKEIQAVKDNQSKVCKLPGISLVTEFIRDWKILL